MYKHMDGHSSGSIVGDQRFMNWTDPDPMAAYYVSVTTGWNSEGHWEFDLFKGWLGVLSLVKYYLCYMEVFSKVVHISCSVFCTCTNLGISKQPPCSLN